jgi:hypothetical protein
VCVWLQQHHNIDHVHFQLVEFHTFLSFIPKVASIETPLSWPCCNSIYFCHLVCMLMVKGIWLF